MAPPRKPRPGGPKPVPHPIRDHRNNPNRPNPGGGSRPPKPRDPRGTHGPNNPNKPPKNKHDDKGKGKNKGKGDNKGKGKDKGKGKNKKKKRSPFFKQAKRMVRQEMRPQLQELRRYLKTVRTQGQKNVAFQTQLGQRTQDDISALFGRANEFNTEQQSKIAQVLGTAQTQLGQSYDTAGANIDDAYSQANENANATLNRLGIQPVSARLAEDQAWLQGLNEQNRGAAAQALAAQQGIFAQSGGMLGQSIAGEGATQMGRAAIATQDAITQSRDQTQQMVNDLLQQRKDIKSNKGMLINQATQLLKQQAFEQMMEQAQLQALNRQRAAQMKLDWAELNSLNQYRQGQLQNSANRLALDKWKAQQDALFKRLNLQQKNKNGKVTRADFMNSDISGWKDATTYAFYWLKKDLKTFRKFNEVITNLKTAWGKNLDIADPGDRAELYRMAKSQLTNSKLWDGDHGKIDKMLRDVLLIGAGKF